MGTATTEPVRRCPTRSRGAMAVWLLTGYGLLILCTFGFVLSRQAQTGICAVS